MSDQKHEKKSHDEAGQPQGAETAPAAAAPEGDQAARPVPTATHEEELAALKERQLRLQADFDNFRRRTQREKAEWSLSANENIFRELLPVLDHFELGLKTAAEHKTEKSVQDGFQLVYDQMLGALRKFGISPLDVHESGFDPAHHEAVAHIPSDEYPADEIIAQTRRGWKLGDRLLRPVQVVISSGPGAPRDDELKSSDPDSSAADANGGPAAGDTKAGV